MAVQVNEPRCNEKASSVDGSSSLDAGGVSSEEFDPVLFDGDIGDVNDETFRDIYGRSITAEDMLAMGDNPASPPVDSEGV